MPRASGSPAQLGTAADVADWLGMSARRVTELRAAGVLPGDKGDAYDIKECVRAYCAHMRPAAGRNAAGGSAGAGALDAARIEVLHEQRDKLRLLNAQLRGEMVLAEDMEAVIGAAFDAARVKALAIPAAYGPRLAVETDPAATREMLTKAIHDALADLADAEVASAVRERSRAVARRDGGGDAAAEEAGSSS